MDKRGCLGCFRDEPLPADSPLWARDDVFVTPHVAALSRPDDVARVFAANLDRYLRGEPLYEVDWGKGVIGGCLCDAVGTASARWRALSGGE